MWLRYEDGVGGVVDGRRVSKIGQVAVCAASVKASSKEGLNLW